MQCTQYACSTYLFLVSGCSWVTEGTVGMRPLTFVVSVGKKDERQVTILRALSQDHLNPVHPRLLLELILEVLHVVPGPSCIPLHPGQVLAKSHQMRVNHKSRLYLPQFVSLIPLTMSVPNSVPDSSYPVFSSKVIVASHDASYLTPT